MTHSYCSFASLKLLKKKKKKKKLFMLFQLSNKILLSLHNLLSQFYLLPHLADLLVNKR